MIISSSTYYALIYHDFLFNLLEFFILYTVKTKDLYRFFYKKNLFEK